MSADDDLLRELTDAVLSNQEVLESMSDVMASNTKVMGALSDFLKKEDSNRRKRESAEKNDGIKDNKHTSDKKEQKEAPTSKKDVHLDDIDIHRAQQIGVAMGQHLRDVIQAAMGRGGGGGGGDTPEGGGGGGGRPGDTQSLAEGRARSEIVSKIDGELDSLRQTLRDLFSQETVDDMREMAIGMMQEVVATTQLYAARFGSGEVGLDYLRERHSAILDATARDIGSFMDSITHNMTAGVQSYQSALEVLVDDIRSGRRTFAVFGGTVSEYAEALTGLRRRTEGLGRSMFNYMTFDEQNQYLASMYDLQVRQGITTQLNSEETARRARRNINFLSAIAHNTGLTVEELISMNQETREGMSELVQRGVVSADLADRMGRMVTAISALDPEFGGRFGEMMGNAPWSAYMSADTSNPGDVLVAGLVQRAFDQLQTGTSTQDALSWFANEIQTLDIGRSLSGLPPNSVGGNISQQLEAIRAALINDIAEENNNTNFVGQLSRWIESIPQRVPILGEFIGLASTSVGAMNILTAAINANTLAVLANSGLSRMVRRSMFSLRTMLSPSLMRNAGQLGGNAVGNSAIARSLGLPARALSSESGQLTALGRNLRFFSGFLRILGPALGAITAGLALFEMNQVTDAERQIGAWFDNSENATDFVNVASAITKALVYGALGIATIFFGLVPGIIAGVTWALDSALEHFTGAGLFDRIGGLAYWLKNKVLEVGGEFFSNFWESIRQVGMWVIENMSPFNWINRIVNMLTGTDLSLSDRIGTVGNVVGSVARATSNIGNINEDALQYDSNTNDNTELVEELRRNNNISERQLAVIENTERSSALTAERVNRAEYFGRPD